MHTVPGAYWHQVAMGVPYQAAMGAHQHLAATEAHRHLAAMEGSLPEAMTVTVVMLFLVAKQVQGRTQGR